MPSIEAALRTAIRREAPGPVASLAVALNRLAKRLAREPQQARPARTGRDTGPVATTGPVPAPMEATPPSAPAPAPTARACAVIGCRRPHRSQGYCAAHYQKRRLMVATGRLHAAWVENAAPHSLPDVILPRGRRPKAESALPPAAAPSPTPTPKVWVRKKGQGVLPLGPGVESAAVAPSAGPGSPSSASPGDARPLQENEHERAVAAAQRWGSDFLAERKGT